MDINQQKIAAAQAALDWLAPQLRPDTIVGVGTGSTADHFIDLLGAQAHRFGGAVASSTRSADRLAQRGVRVLDLNDVTTIPAYIDGADEIDDDLAMIKGGGGALTREKIVAAVAERFVCIVDGTKRVAALGRFPLPIEVIPMARAQVERALHAIGRDEALGETVIALRRASDGREFVTDNGNCIIDVKGWTIHDPRALETRIGRLVGVVESGLFAWRGADLLLMAGPDGVTSQSRVNK